MHSSETTSWIVWLKVFASNSVTLKLLADHCVVTCLRLRPISRSSTVTWIKSVRQVFSQVLWRDSRQTYRLASWESYQKRTNQIDGVSSSTCHHPTRLALTRALVETCVNYLRPAVTSQLSASLSWLWYHASQTRHPKRLSLHSGLSIPRVPLRNPLAR